MNPSNYYLAANLLTHLALVILLLIFYLWQQQLRWAPAAPAGAGTFPGTYGLLLAASEEKTEAATPHRRQEARKKGQVARSADLNAAMVLIAIIVVLYSFKDYLGLNLSEYVQYILAEEMSSTLNSDQFFALYKTTLFLGLKLMAPIFVAAILFGVVANFLQVGLMFTPEAIKPKLSSINPLEGLKKIFSKRALFDFLKTLLKIFIIGLVIYKLVKSNFPNLLMVLNMNIASITAYLNGIIYKICITAAVVFLIISILDLVFQKWQFSQTLKMSKYEVKKEMQQTEGDPLIKARLREKQRLLAMRRMMQSVPDATVVITNPTHLAVVLKYDDNEMSAPQITAKGAGYVAATIKAKALENNIPIIEDKPLARSLYKVEIGDYVPVELYQAVAGILAAIYSLRRNRGAADEI